MIQRRLQLENQYWLNQVPLMAAGVLPPTPNYNGILRDVQLRLWNNFQGLPPRYVVQPPPPAPMLPSLNNGGPPPLVIPPAAPAPLRQPAAAGVTNPTPNAGFIARYGRYGGRLRVLTNQLRDQLPTADNGRSQICLAYCLTGNCNSNCRRRDSHRPLTASEEARVAAFLTAGNVE